MELSMKAFSLVPIVGAITWCWWLTDVFRRNRPRALTSQAQFVVLLLGILGLGVLTVLVYFFGAEALSSGLHLLTLLAFILRATKGTVDSGPTNNRDDDDDRQQQEALSEIVKTVAAMPVEEFVPESDMEKKCTVGQLKRMLEIRTKHQTQHVAENVLERSDLVDSLRRCRKSSESCCICLNDYIDIAGDGVRVLPKCCHEFHVECIDQCGRIASPICRHEDRDESHRVHCATLP
eukprot:scaffold22288_cov50-Attheya_sp.AAC.1